MLGWMWGKTRKANLATLMLTLFSWVILGIWYGWGYCFCTDWHWQVREALGNPIESYSYIHFLILEITGINVTPHIVDKAVLGIFITCLAMSIMLNLRDFRNKRKKR